MKVSKIFRGDRTLWVLFLLFSIISLVEVYSSIGLFAYSLNGGKPTGLFLRHLLIVIVTWVIVIGASRINYRYFSRFAVMGFWVSLVLLAVVMMLGGRWLSLPVVSQFQPSEVAKVALVLFIARMLTLKKEQAAELGTFLSLLVYIVLVVALVLPENFSTSALIFISCYLMMLFGGVNRKWWWRLMLVIALGAGVGLAVTYNRYSKKVNNTEQVETVSQKQLLERSSTWGHRVYSWLNPDTNALTQENMARMAVAHGGMFGVGPGNTIHARLMTQAHNDFIYAIILEETGLVGGVIVFLLYSFFYFCCVRLSWRCKGRFGSLTVAGLGTMIYLQALANMGVAVGVLPVTGQTLPFISYGGTAYMFLGLGLGIIQSVAADVNSEKEKALAEAQPSPAIEPAVAEAPAEEEGEMLITDDTDNN